MDATAVEWKPDETLTGVDAAFGPRNCLRLMPAMADIPDEFKRRSPDSCEWVRFQNDWFFFGLAKLKATPKAGINELAALRHLGAINRSFEPSHEHKEAAVAYLASLWFDDVQYTRGEPEE